MNEAEKSICDNICLIIQDGLRSVCDPIIFSKTTFIELGEFYYSFIISNVEGANIELYSRLKTFSKKSISYFPIENDWGIMVSIRLRGEIRDE